MIVAGSGGSDQVESDIDAGDAAPATISRAALEQWRDELIARHKCGDDDVAEHICPHSGGEPGASYIVPFRGERMFACRACASNILGWLTISGKLVLDEAERVREVDAATQSKSVGGK